MSRDTTCLYSQVKNVSGAARHFGYLPPHGRDLDANEEMLVWGSVLEAVQRSVDRDGPRHYQALENDVATAVLEIRKLPNPILLDAGTEDMQMLEIINGEIRMVEPCWESLSEA
jgi:hypothetical protein